MSFAPWSPPACSPKLPTEISLLKKSLDMSLTIVIIYW